MPLLTFQRQSSSLVWAVWHISESLQWFLQDLPAEDVLPSEITHPKKKAEWLAGRFLVRHILSSQAITYEGLWKDVHGKPWISGQPNMQLSLSNSFPLVAAAVHPDIPLGIDIERPRSGMLQVVPRILSEQEAGQINGSVERACMLWCAKESLYKKIGNKTVSLRRDIHIDVLPEAVPGRISGTVFGERIQLNCHRVADHLLTVTEPYH